MCYTPVMKLGGISGLRPFVTVLMTWLVFALPAVADDAKKARRAVGDMDILKLGLKSYYKHFDHLPNNTEGLWALMIPEKSADESRDWPGFLRKMMLDPWGNEYHFKRVGDMEYGLRSYGPDGIRSDDDVTLGHRVVPGAK